MKYKKVIVTIVVLFAIFQLMLSCKVGRFIIYNFAGIDDYKIFDSRTIKKDSISFYFFRNEKNIAPKEINNIPFDEYLEKNETVAFLVIRNDSILYEKYFNDYQKESIVASFSVAKSVTSILIGCAIDEQLIKTIDEPVTNYIPKLKKNGFEKITIKNLLQMTSGIDFNESYINPFGQAASFYYGTNLRNEINKLKLKSEPGTSFNYVSGDTQLLGLVLERSLKTKTISQYLEEKIWKPLQMEYDATWSLDQEKNGLEKTFCCLNARARDFAKIGKLYLQKGKWNGKQIVSQKWVEESTKLDISQGSYAGYQYQWWLPTPGKDFMAEGILGQYIYVNPDKNIIIVRLGKDYGQVDWSNIFVKLSNTLIK